ncbi:hypothetical protein Psesu_2667 [Pseudoxanthomonas suwonensis 11-1]|uniref:DUF3016 domain-containing protein n=1 Tax=Pseudoxanthomonas suwonensis (strain 11-1) TaxID=743721 RepID=E6WW04_PSEUU|nr:hypothetical protein Psesu_2667 [Pseudoxanthomonas suwonensis 11-1]
MKYRSMILLLALAAMPATVLAGSNVTDPDAPRALQGDGPVTVTWTDPAGFSDLRYSGNRWEAEKGDWVAELARHLQKSAAKRLPEGARMEVTITDIQRAGRYEPWHGADRDHVRILRDNYPPMIELQFKLTSADGQVLAEGQRKLRDTAYLQRSSGLDSDNLRHEKRMIDDWVRKELKAG